MDTCTAAQIIEAATPLLTALIAAIAVYFPARASGLRTPRREEHEKDKVIESLQAQVRDSAAPAEA